MNLLLEIGLWVLQSGLTLMVAFFAFQRAIDNRLANLDVSLATFRGDMKSDIRDLGTRVGKLETGQDEWTQTLRARTHELAEKLQVVQLKVDRLERPTKPH